MRPTVDDETAEKIASIVDKEASVPADHLTFNQQVNFVAEHYETVRAELQKAQQSQGGPLP